MNRVGGTLWALLRPLMMAGAATFLFATSADAAVSESRGFQADAAHTGYVDAEIEPAQLGQRWTKRIEGFGYFSYPVIADGRLFVIAKDLTTGSATLWAYDLASGRKLWSRSAGEYRTARVTYDAGRLFATEGSGVVRAMDPETGRTLWAAHHSQESIDGIPTAANGKLYVRGSGFGSDLDAFAQADGSTVWTGDAGPLVSYDAGRLLTQYDCRTQSKSADTGALLWSMPTACSSGTMPSIHGGRGYDLGRPDGVSRAMADGRQVQRFEFGPQTFYGDAPRVAFRADVGIFVVGNEVRAQNLDTAETLWSFDAGLPLAGAPLIVGTHVFVTTTAGRLYSFDLESGEQEFADDTGEAIYRERDGLAAADGVVAVPTGDRLLVYSSRDAAEVPTPPAPTGSIPAPEHVGNGATAYQGNAAHDGFTEGNFLEGGLRVRWSRTVKRTTTPVVIGGRAFFVETDSETNGDTLRAVRLSDGRTLWARDAPQTTFRGDAEYLGIAYGGGHLLTYRPDGTLEAHDPATGVVKWSEQAQGRATSAPTAAGDTVYFGSEVEGAARFTAVNAATGQQRWSRSLAYSANALPTVAADAVYTAGAAYTGGPCRSQKFDRATGNLIWARRCSEDGGTVRAVRGDRLYAGTNVFSTADGGLVDLIGRPVFPETPAIAGRHVITPNARTLQAEDYRDGRTLWEVTVPPGDFFDSPATVVGDDVVAGSRQGVLHLVDRNTGALEWTGSVGAEMRGEPFAAAEGSLVVSADGRLVVLDNEADGAPSIEAIGSTSDATPEVRFASAGDAAQCRVDDGAWAACSSPWVTPSLSEGEHAVAVRAGSQGTPSSELVAVDTEPPETDITQAPAERSTVSHHVFRFGVMGPPGQRARFECRLDAGAWRSCVSPHRIEFNDDYREEVPHTFEVRATDAAGNVETVPARHRWVLDRDSPAVAFTEAPQVSTQSRSARFEFTMDEPGTLRCRLNETEFRDCSSPHLLAGLEDGRYTFDVQGRDQAGNTRTATHTWTVDNRAPGLRLYGPPEFDNRATIWPQFTADGDVGFACRIDDGIWTACESSDPVGPLSDGPHRFAVRATDGAGNSATQDVGWTVDTVKPVVTQQSPQGEQPPGQASIAFSVNEPTRAVSCAFERASGDSSVKNPCESPVAWPAYSTGAYKSTITATDRAGNVGESVSRWTVDADPPSTSLTSSVPDPASTSATFTYSSGDPNAAFECALDGENWASCPREGQSVTGLGDGRHQFAVRAVDSVGNHDATPATREWTVDTKVPETAIRRAPPPVTADPGVEFEFGSDRDDATFECRLEGDWSPCSSPHRVTASAEREYTLEVRARRGTRIDPTPATASWRVDRTPPRAAIDSGPTPQTFSSDARFEFSADDPRALFSCRLDGGAWDQCASPAELAGLGEGSHEFEVRATDEAGNPQETPASWMWMVQAPTTPGPGLQPQTGAGTTVMPGLSPAPPDSRIRPSLTFGSRSTARALLGRAVAELRRVSARRLIAGRSVPIMASGTARARIRLTLSLTTRTGRVGARLYTERLTVGRRGRARFRVRLTAGARTRLRRARSRTLLVNVGYRPLGGSPVVSKGSVRLR